MGDVVAGGVGVALVVAVGALVNIGTVLAVAFVALWTGALVAAVGVGALGAGEALGDSGLALVDVLASGLLAADEPVADVAWVAGASHITWEVGAGGVLGAGVLVLALVVVGAGDAVALPAVVADADEALGLVEADGIGIAVMGAVGALIDKRTLSGCGSWLGSSGGDDNFGNL